MANQIQTLCPFSVTDNNAKNIISFITEKLNDTYPQSPPLRAFHAKTIGLLKADLVIDQNLKHDLRVGLFKDHLTYPAWVRFTNGSPEDGDDGEGGFRGMAIKILYTDKEQNNGEEATQDIILTTAKNFVPGTGALALDGVKVILGNLLQRATGLLNVVTTSVVGLMPFLKSIQTSPNVLEEMYYSGTPFKFGNRIIKWHARPLKTITTVMPDKPHKDFLRQQLISDLSPQAKEKIAFAIMIQFQQNATTEPINDSAVIWKTPFIKVATLVIPKQQFYTKERKTLDEIMSFNVSNSLPEHAPVGSVNMVRAVVYKELSRQRVGSMKD